MSERRVDAVFSALSDPTRRQVLRALAQHGAATATELAGRFPVSRQAIAKHLTALADAGLVGSSRHGRELRYEVTPAPLNDALAWITDVGAEWDDRLGSLKRYLSRR